MADGKDKHQRNDAAKQHEPTDGPGYDDRGPDPQGEQEAALRAAHVQLAHDRPARVLTESVQRHGTEITISGGLKQGVTVGMTGYLTGPGRTYDFTIASVEATTAKAVVETTPDEIRAHPQVIINPSVKPTTAKHQDLPAQLLHIEVVQGGTRIVISKGRMQGVAAGERGIVADASGRQLVSFALDEVESNISRATVELTPDQLNGAKITLSPSGH